MRATTLLTAICLLSAVVPAAMAGSAGEYLRERNRAMLLEDLDHPIPEDATAQVVTEDGETTMPAIEAIELFLDHLDRANIDLSTIDTPESGPPAPALAGQAGFPLARTGGSIVESEVGSGPLPEANACDRVKTHSVSEGALANLDPVFAQPGDGFVTSTLSTILSPSIATVQATMGDPSGSLNDTVAGYSGAILAGPNHETTCLATQLCLFGCFHIINHVTTLSTGAVLDGDVAQTFHDQAPLAPLPEGPV